MPDFSLAPASRIARARAGDAAGPSAAGIETELKLIAPAGILAQIERSPVLSALARNRGTTRHLEAVYYDTTDRLLHRAGTSLRVRRLGRQLIQTLKAPSGLSDTALARREWEMPVEAGLDLARLLPLLPEPLHELVARGPLSPVFSITVLRRRRMLDLPTGQVEFAFDQGVIEAGARSLPVEEIELELKAGAVGVLHDVALRLAELGPVRPSLLSKSDRGYALLSDAPPAVAKASMAVDNDDPTTADAMLAILRSALQHFVANQPAAEDGRDPEGVHQLRVALRRLRSALSLVRKLAPSPALDALRAEAKWLAGSLGDARNWDVFVNETLPPIAGGCGLPEGFAAMRERADAQRAEGYRQARAALADARAGRLALGLGAWLERRDWIAGAAGEHAQELSLPVGRFASHLLVRGHKRILRKGRHFKRMPAQDRHQLRLKVKKLRYTADFFLPLLGGKAQAGKDYVRSLARLQDELGRFNDVSTTRALIESPEAEALPPAGERAFGAIIGWQAADLGRLELRVRKHWRSFRKAGTPWRAP